MISATTELNWLDQNCGRLDWSVLKVHVMIFCWDHAHRNNLRTLQWNTPSIEFYEKALDAKSMTEWLGMRLEDDGIEKLKQFVR